MNKNEIGKMISLADDSYIEEMFTTRLYERKHHGAAWIAAAAAVVIAVGAAGVALNSADSGKIITDLQEILTETETDTSAPESVVTTREWSYRTNNRGYFKNKPDDTAESYYSLLENYIGFTSEGPEYRFAPGYLDGILLFERKDFLNIEGGLQCGKNGVPLYAEIRLFNDGTENLPMVHMVFYKENSPFADFDKSLYTPEIYGDTELYGFDLSEKKDGSKLMAYWRYGDTNYMFTSRGLDFDKFIKIISTYIEFYREGDHNLMYRDYFTLDSFDLNNGVIKSVSDYKGSNEMNSSSVFAGYVPNYTPFVGLHLTESPQNYEEATLDGEVIYRRYHELYIAPESYETGNGSEKVYISLIYEWGENPDSDTVNHAPIIPFEEITPEKLDEILFDEDNCKLYQFIIPVNDFTITVLATCEREQLLEAIDAIRSQGGNVTQLTLEDANTNTPFAGYVPQSSSISGLNFVRAIKEDTMPLRLQLQYRGEENDFDKAYTEYVHLYYYDEREIGDRAVRPVVRLEDITAEKLEEIKYFGDSHETKHSFYVTVSDFFIRVEALCPSEKLTEFFEDMPRELDYINSSGTIMYNGQEFDRALLSKETIEWIERYNELPEEEQLATSSVPHDLNKLLNGYGAGVSETAPVVTTVKAESETAPAEAQAKAGAGSETVMYDGREYLRSDLSKETLEWLDWYNSASKEEQASVSYVPSELLTFLEYSF